jgi:tRNA dimethylallyltransferase
MNNVIIILGPTGVGKTGLSILIAKALKTEIISADSMLVYKHMDIGTAKPSAEELRAVPHHLINILSPSETFSAGQFKEKATELIDSLHAKNKIPVIAGGTGLYIRSLTKGLFEGPGADDSLRKTLKQEAETEGSDHLYEKLTAIDPESARKINKNDTRRLIRALEVSLRSEKGISELRKQSTLPLHYDFIKIGLTRDRKELYPMIEERVDRMMQSGLLEETKRLLTFNPGRTALQALGYKEILLHIQGNADLEESIRLIKKHTKEYAKRQFTWFKKEPSVHWVDITGIHDREEIYAAVLNKVEILKNLIYS